MKTILIIDDNKDFHENMVEVLQMELYLTLEAENGLIGLQMIDDYILDLILCDVDKPVMNGIEVLKSMKDDLRHSNTPFIFITGHSDDITRKTAENLGANLFLAKTISLTYLLNAILPLLSCPVL